MDSIQEKIQAIKSKLLYDKTIRDSNLIAANIEENYFRCLDSSLKKNSGFVKKLKCVSWNQIDFILQDFSKLNMTKYIGEVASALVESKVKVSDLPNVMKFCNIAHKIYVDFSSEMIQCWKRKWNPLLEQSEMLIDHTKLRADLKFYAELINAGIIKIDAGVPLLESLLKHLIETDENDHKFVAVILSFCQLCGYNFGNLVSKELHDGASTYKLIIPQNKLLSEAKHLVFRTLYKKYYASLVKRMLRVNRELRIHERKNRHIIKVKGELSKERQEKSDDLKSLLRSLQVSVSDLAEILNEEIPIIQDEEKSEDEELTNNEALFSNVWEDDETKLFYEQLPELKTLVPANSEQNNTEIPVSEEALAADYEDIDDNIETKSTDDDVPPPPEIDIIEEPDKCTKAKSKNSMDIFLDKLRQSECRDLIDQCAEEFATKLNTKFNRKRLVKALFEVPGKRLDLLPCYARLTAALFPVAPDIAQELNYHLKRNFKYHVHKKEQINLNIKLKTMRFIGELVKFNMYSKIEALFCLKILLNNFNHHHHIEMCCQFIEICGRYLFRNKISHYRMKFYLEVLMRKKSVMLLDSRYVTMIENAYYEIYPPDRICITKKELSPEQELIRKLLYEELNKTNVEYISQQMLKFDWKNEDVAKYIIRCLVCGFRVKYYNIRYLASVVAAISETCDIVATQVTEGVLRNIQYGLENNLTIYNQQRVAMVKYLCELYAYRLVRSKTMFDVIYTFITFGVSYDREQPSPLDPPDNLFRIRMCCIVLDTLGNYMDSEYNNRKLDLFLVFFQYYFWFKYSIFSWTNDSPFPVQLKYFYEDILMGIRPEIELFTSFEKSCLEIHKIKERYIDIVKNSAVDGNENCEAAIRLDLRTIIEVTAKYDIDKQKKINPKSKENQTENFQKNKNVNDRKVHQEQTIIKPALVSKPSKSQKNETNNSVAVLNTQQILKVDQNEKCIRKAKVLLGIGRGKPVTRKVEG